jgi:hypothetical protein
VKHRHEDEAKDSFNENRYVELHKQNLVNLWWEQNVIAALRAENMGLFVTAAPHIVSLLI